MNRIVALFLLSTMAIATAQNYQLVWSDEFNGNSLDLSKWQYEQNCDGGGNAEMQCYTNSPSNLRVNNGSLTITATIQAGANGKQYSSARINTQASAAWKYGKFEINAKLPNGIYLWPALWLLPRDQVYGSWAASGEIDIMENRGGNNYEQQSTLHFGGGWPNNIYQGSGPQNMPNDLTAGFHRYAAIWTPDSIQFLVADWNYYTISLQRSFWNNIGTNPYGGANQKPFDQYFYFIINLAVGGGFFGNNAGALSQAQARAWVSPSLVIDYVRVYQLSNSPVVAPVAAPSTSSVVAAAPATTAAAASGSSTCAAGCPNGLCSCGGACYVAGQYSCPFDPVLNKAVLCSGVQSSCGGSCYDASKQSCVNGGLQNGGVQAVAAPATKASTFTTSSTTSAAAATPTSAAAATPTPVASSSSACPNGCGTGLCCNDARNGGQCYSTSNYVCIQDTFGFHLCSIGQGSCNNQCYSPSSYKCVNNSLQSL